jgi:uncharacterized protein YjbJ (UPF0337 family)
MTDERTKGTINTTKGAFKEGAGKLTGDKGLEAKGTVQQVQGKAQKGLADVQDRLRKTGSDPD